MKLEYLTSQFTRIAEISLIYKKWMVCVKTAHNYVKPS